MNAVQAHRQADALRISATSLCVARAVERAGPASPVGEVGQLEEQTAVLLRDFGEALGLHMPAVDPCYVHRPIGPNENGPRCVAKTHPGASVPHNTHP